MRLPIIVLTLLASVASAQNNLPRDTLLMGSSSVNGALGRQIEWELEQLGLNIIRRGRGSSGFARPDFLDMQAQIDEIGPMSRYRAVMLIAGGNDTQSILLRPDERPNPRERWVEWANEDGWRAVYRARVRAFVDTLCQRGARRVIVILPLDGGRPGWSRRILRVREELAAGATHECGQALDAAERPDEVFGSLDGVHLNREGARRAWARLQQPLRRLLGL